MSHPPVRQLTFAFSLLLLAAAETAFGADEPPQKPTAQAAAKTGYLQFALKHDGDAANGERLYRNNDKLKCTACHRVTGMELSGPNLEGIGDKFSRRELIREVLYPSDQIKPGFEQVTVVRKDGRVYVGRLERANRAVHRLIDAAGKQTDVPTDEIETVKISSISMMPENLEALLSKQEFADLIAYLGMMKFQNRRGLVAGGREIEIPRLKPPVTLTPIHSPKQKFENPVWCGALPGTANDLVVVEHHSSRIWRLVRNGGPLRKELFLDLSGQTYLSNNQGLMCVAFHPGYVKNHRYFLVHEVEEEGQVKTTVVERHATDDGLSDSGRASTRLLEVFQPAFNHNGGCLAFGPDGMLYVAFGDGGPQKDPNGYAQNPRIFHGSMLRIDVDRRDPGLNYAIPPDNPFLAAHEKDPDIRAETWAIGFREPWRFSFDPKTGELYVGDVGQSSFEEVCLAQRGKNYGWNVREGFAPFSDEYARPGERYTDPLFAYEHGLGFSVTGGYVYRGKKSPSFVGAYIFGDYNTRKIWALRQTGGVVRNVTEIGTAPGGLCSFGVDQWGEIYLVTYMGTIYHVDLSSTQLPPAAGAAEN